jgi:hypothetical protein
MSSSAELTWTHRERLAPSQASRPESRIEPLENRIVAGGEKVGLIAECSVLFQVEVKDPIHRSYRQAAPNRNRA